MWHPPKTQPGQPASVRFGSCAASGGPDPVRRQISELLDDFDDDEEDEVEGPDGLLIPKYEFMYKQAVSTADAFLGMSHNKVRNLVRFNSHRALP